MKKFKVGKIYKIIGDNGKLGHHFNIGEKVKLVRLEDKEDHCYENERGFSQYVCDEDVIEYHNEQKIVITTDGTETLARLYEDGKVVKSAIAKCSPEDEFNFNIGAKLAFDRLIGEEKASEKWRVVHRPAIAGDYVRIKEACFSFNKIEDILKVATTEGNGAIAVKACDHPRKTGVHSDYLWHYLPCHYEVIESCTAEKKEEYYNGKAVCIASNFPEDVKVGKIYDFSENGGCGKNDSGGEILAFPRKDLESINAAFSKIRFIQFIE